MSNAQNLLSCAPASNWLCNCVVQLLRASCSKYALWLLQAQGVPLVRARHLRAAAAKARLSVPASERNRLEAIYSKFRSSRDAGLGQEASRKGKGKRTTLA